MIRRREEPLSACPWIPRADMTQAVLEGVAFAIRDSFEVAKSLGIHIERTRICGGGQRKRVRCGERSLPMY